MDELANLVRRFCLFGNEINNRDYEICFIRIMMTIMSMIREALINERDERETNEYYSLIFGDISRMQRHLGEYLDFVLGHNDME